MNPKFSVIFLEEAAEFLDRLDDKSRRKVIYNIDKSRYVNDLKRMKMKSYTLGEIKDKYIGEVGSPDREYYELELKVELIGEAIKDIRQKKSMTQSELGELIGVKKAQISKLENNTTNVSIGTLMRVFDALGTKVKLYIETEGVELEAD